VTDTILADQVPDVVPPYEAVWQLTNATIASHCLFIAAELGVADHIDDRPVSVATLAARCGVDADSLNRVLRLLETYGLFAHRSGGYAHTEASRLLRADHPRSMRAFPRMMGLPLFTSSFDRLDHSLRTGAPALELLAPNGMWAYLREHPHESEIFTEAMTAKAHADVSAVLASYDFSGYRRIADIGGGAGHLVTAILETCEDATGVLFELPNVAAGVIPHPRLDVVAGDFFTDPLPACDAYLLMNVIHDYADEDAHAILTATALAGRAAGATVLLIESVMPTGPEPHWSKVLDVIMLAVTGGRERTQAEYKALLSRSGLSLVRTIATATPFSIIEARVERS
jgi:hypothetical protein